jgi:hypothetical protein
MKFFAFSLGLMAGLLLAALAAAQVVPAPVAPVAPAMPGYAPAVPAARPLPASQWTALQIRQSFDLADSDSNGQLTRAEAQQLTIMPRTFEEMDQNKDGVVARGEYESIFAPR